jgi:hypothetical protein
MSTDLYQLRRSRYNSFIIAWGSTEISLKTSVMTLRFSSYMVHSSPPAFTYSTTRIVSVQVIQNNNKKALGIQ